MGLEAVFQQAHELCYSLLFLDSIYLVLVVLLYII